jgi:hypothetical protein
MCLQRHCFSRFAPLWGDVIIYYQTMPNSQSANQQKFCMILGQQEPSHPTPNPYNQKLFLTVKNVPKLYPPNCVNITSWPIIGAANMAEHFQSKVLTFFKFLSICYHQYIGGNMSVPPIGKELQTGSTKNLFSQIFLVLAAPIYIGARWLAALMIGAL